MEAGLVRQRVELLSAEAKPPEHFEFANDVRSRVDEVPIGRREFADTREVLPVVSLVVVPARLDPLDADDGVPEPPRSLSNAEHLDRAILMGKGGLVAAYPVVAHVAARLEDIRRGVQHRRREHEHESQHEDRRETDPFGGEHLRQRGDVPVDGDRAQDRGDRHNEPQVSEKEVRRDADEKGKRIGHEDEQPHRKVPEKRGRVRVELLVVSQQADQHEQGYERGEQRRDEKELEEYLGDARADRRERPAALLGDRRGVLAPFEDEADDLGEDRPERPTKGLTGTRPEEEHHREKSRLSVQRPVGANPTAGTVPMRGELNQRNRDEQADRVRGLLGVIYHDGD